MVTFHGILTIKDGKRAEYAEALKQARLIEAFRQQPGCLFYEVAASITEENDLVVSDGWNTEADFKGHVDSPEVAIWHQLYAQYVVSAINHEYHFEPEMNK